MTSRTVDVAIIGAGIAGASLAAAIGDRARVLLLEGEAQPGYHATGRSAAFWSESYGGAAVQPLTSASEAALGPFLAPRGCLHIASADNVRALDILEATFAGRRPHLERVGRAELVRRLPGLRDDWVAGVAEPSCRDIDVAAFHADCLAEARRSGAEIVSDARVRAIARRAGRWHVEAGGERVSAAVVVNAAGAWATGVAALAGAMPLCIAPHRRTVVQLVTDPAMPVDAPLVMDAGGGFYLKPEAGGRLWLSPHDEHAVHAHDVAAEEIDVAIAIDRLERTFDWRIVRRERAWAGLRSFARDRAPVYGFDRAVPGFFWCAGQGGFGIQTAPATAALAAALLLGAPLPAWLVGVDPARYAPDRAGLY